MAVTIDSSSLQDIEFIERAPSNEALIRRYPTNSPGFLEVRGWLQILQTKGNLAWAGVGRRPSVEGKSPQLKPPVPKALGREKAPIISTTPKVEEKKKPPPKGGVSEERISRLPTFERMKSDLAKTLTKPLYFVESKSLEEKAIAKKPPVIPSPKKKPVLEKKVSVEIHRKPSVEVKEKAPVAPVQKSLEPKAKNAKADRPSVSKGQGERRTSTFRSLVPLSGRALTRKEVVKKEVVAKKPLLAKRVADDAKARIEARAKKRMEAEKEIARKKAAAAAAAAEKEFEEATKTELSKAPVKKPPRKPVLPKKKEGLGPASPRPVQSKLKQKKPLVSKSPTQKDLIPSVAVEEEEDEEVEEIAKVTVGVRGDEALGLREDQILLVPEAVAILVSVEDHPGPPVLMKLPSEIEERKRPESDEVSTSLEKLKEDQRVEMEMVTIPPPEKPREIFPHPKYLSIVPQKTLAAERVAEQHWRPYYPPPVPPQTIPYEELKKVKEQGEHRAMIEREAQKLLRKQYRQEIESTILEQPLPFWERCSPCSPCCYKASEKQVPSKQRAKKTRPALSSSTDKHNRSEYTGKGTQKQSSSIGMGSFLKCCQYPEPDSLSSSMDELQGPPTEESYSNLSQMLDDS